MVCKSLKSFVRVKLGLDLLKLWIAYEIGIEWSEVIPNQFPFALLNSPLKGIKG